MKYIFVFTLLTLAILSSCSPLKYRAKQSTLIVPENIPSDSNASVLVVLDYKSFYSDPYLQHLIDTALENNYDLQIAAQRVAVSRGHYSAEKFNRMPSLDIHAGIGTRKYSDYTMDGVGLFDQNLSPNVSGDFITPSPFVPDYTTGFITSWEIDFWGKLKSLKKAAKNRYLSSVEAKRNLTSILVNEVAKNYYLLLAYDEELKIAQNNSLLQAKAYEMVTFQKQGGMANELAVSQLKAQYLNTQSLMLIIHQRIIETENHINFLLGRFPQAIERSTALFEIYLPIETSNFLPSELILNRPDVQSLAFELDASNANLKAAQAAFLPSFNLNALIGLQAFRPDNFARLPESVAMSLFGGLTQPLFQKNILKSQFNISKAQQISALYEFEKSIVNGYREVANNLNKITLLNEALTLKNEEVETLNRSVEISNDLFSTGNSTYLEVITAQRMVLQEEINFVFMKFEEINAKIDLYRALGGGTQ